MQRVRKSTCTFVRHVAARAQLYRANICQDVQLVDLCLRTFEHYTSPNQVVDDFAVAQNTPLPKCIAGVEGDKV